jgi:hypothetical protein
VVLLTGAATAPVTGVLLVVAGAVTTAGWAH